jgi:DNA polymerase III subunit gamma/tau
LAYLVLARRYRPQSFSELIGQQHIVTILTNAINSERVHHAFLFTGARGTGKTTTARLLAKALNCSEGPTPEPCNKCVHCLDIKAGKEVDVLEIDGATNTGVESVRALREDIRYLPSSAKFRIVIIDEVHMLSVSAFNALLKTLEEPPEHVIFIFATTEPHKIPATILSRVQRFDFKRVEISVLSQHVIDILEKEKFEIENEAARLIALEGEGSVRDTLSILDQILANHTSGKITVSDIKNVLGITDKQILETIGYAILNRDGDKVLTILNDVFYDGYDIVHFSKSLVAYFRDLLVIKSCKNPEKLLFSTLKEIKKANQTLKPWSAQHIHHLFLRLFNGFDTISRALSPKTALELILMDMVLAEPLQPLGDLFNKLQNLEKSVKNSVSLPSPITNNSNRSTPVVPQKKKDNIQQLKPKNSITETSAPTIKSSASQPSDHTKRDHQLREPSTNKSRPPISNKPLVVSDYGFKEWLALLDSLGKEHGNLFVCLQTARFSSSITDGKKLIFHLLFPKGENTYCLKYIRSEKRTIEDFFSKTTGHAISIEISESEKTDLPANWQKLPEGVPVHSPDEDKKQKEAVESRNLHETIRNDPLVVKFINDLHGSILGQKPLI